MKKSLLAMMTLAGSGLACAQSNVEIYGVIDAGFTYVSDQNGSSDFAPKDGANYGNRLGFRGSEDLGGGMKAIFTLEHGFDLNHGTVAKYQPMFGRQAFVGLQTQAGTVTLGRQYDFVFDYLTQLNVGGFASVYAGHHGDFDRISGWRVDNAIKFKSANHSGWSFGAMYAPDEGQGGRTVSLGAGYYGGQWSLGAAYVKLKNTTLNPEFQIGLPTFLGQTLPWDGTPLKVDSQEVVALGGSYQLGALTLVGNTTQTTFKGFAATERQRVYEFGGIYPLAAQTLAIAGYQHSSLQGKQWNQLTLGVKHNLSKRTWLYASVSAMQASAGVLANQGAGYYLDNSSTRRQSTARVAMITTF